MHSNISKSGMTNDTYLSTDSGNSSLNLSPEVIINIVFFILLALTIIVANLLVLASIRFNPRLRSPEYVLILSLSVADLMVGLFLLPVRIMDLLSTQWVTKFMWCNMTISLTLFILSASLLNLLAVAMDRYLAISYSLKYNSFITVTKMCFAIVMVWLTAVTVSFLPLLGVGTKSVEINRFRHPCRFADTLDETYLGLYFVFICATPTVLITAAYFKIFLLARSQERRIASLRMYVEELSAKEREPRQSSKPLFFTRESKAAKTIAIIIGLFYLCWIPFFAGILLTIFKQEAVSYLYIAFVTCLAYSNSAINPLVYGWLNQEFKNTYKRLVKGLLRFTRPRCLSTKSNVTHVTRIKKSSVRNTVTATISATHSEIVSQNFRPASCFTGNL